MTGTHHSIVRRPSARLAVFGLLERLSTWRQGNHCRPSSKGGPAQSASAAPSVWVFVSTIGELNAIDPFLQALLRLLGEPPLTLISDRLTYGDAYRKRFPQAAVEVIDGTGVNARELARRHPPSLLVVAEIPCGLHDAPCRFPFAMVQAVKDAGAPAVVVNGWLYGYEPPSRLDAIEQHMFSRQYIRSFDLMLVQTAGVRTQLIEYGAEPGKVSVTGNIKFDALDANVLPEGPLANAFKQVSGPIIVAGSITQADQARGLIDAFLMIKASHPGALLILAPRHPENQTFMSMLAGLLDTVRLRWRLRGATCDALELGGFDVMVLDTMGELRGCYAAASLAFVGTDHNVLEPLAFGKIVFTAGRWESTYPSYPVFSELVRLHIVRHVPLIEDLGLRWRQALNGEDSGHESDVKMKEMRGASQRCLNLLLQAGLLVRSSSLKRLD